MAKKPARKPAAKKNPIDRTRTPTGITKEKAYEVYQDLFASTKGQTTLKRCYDELIKRYPDAKLSYASIALWARSHDWQTRARDRVKQEIIDTLTPYTPAMSDDAIIGLQGEMVMAIHRSVENMVLSNPSEIKGLLECIQDLTSIRDGAIVVPGQAETRPATAHKEKLAQVMGNVKQLVPKP